MSSEQPNIKQISESEDRNVSKFEENKAAITRILVGADIPLVLRSEQKMTLPDEIRQEVSVLLDENIRLTEEIIKLNKSIFEEDEYLLRVANFYYFVDNIEKSIKIYNRVLEKNPTKMVALNNKGVVLDSLGDYDQALKSFNQALTRVPENVHLLCNNGISLYKSERYLEALECFDAALKIDANYVSALTFKGHSLYKLGKNVEALEWYNKVIRLDRNNAEALYNKACLCSLKRDEYGAITSLERAVSLDSSWKDAAIHDKDLENLNGNSRFLKLVNKI